MAERRVTDVMGESRRLDHVDVEPPKVLELLVVRRIRKKDLCNRPTNLRDLDGCG